MLAGLIGLMTAQKVGVMYSLDALELRILWMGTQKQQSILKMYLGFREITVISSIT